MLFLLGLVITLILQSEGSLQYCRKRAGQRVEICGIPRLLWCIATDFLFWTKWYSLLLKKWKNKAEHLTKNWYRSAKKESKPSPIENLSYQVVVWVEPDNLKSQAIPPATFVKRSAKKEEDPKTYWKWYHQDHYLHVPPIFC